MFKNFVVLAFIIPIAYFAIEGFSLAWITVIVLGGSALFDLLRKKKSVKDFERLMMTIATIVCVIGVNNYISN